MASSIVAPMLILCRIERLSQIRFMLRGAPRLVRTCSVDRQIQ
jgi:hypothetical protein